MARGKPTFLILSQVYVPDPASVGQHLADTADELVRRGWRVVVLTANRGYDDPSQRYPARETRHGVEIVRVPWASLGKKSLTWRLAGSLCFLVQAIVRGLFIRNLRGVLFSTSPPLCPLAAVVLGMLKRVPIKFWVMDLNPDEAIALGKVAPNGVPARLFRWMNRLATRRAADVVVLDRFMADRVGKLSGRPDRITILPPWPHEDELEPVVHADNPFRRRHGLEGKFVVMYSGNHSIASPLTTLLEAALRLQNDDRLRFLFIGGGLGKREIDQAIQLMQPTNIVSLPYQPLESIRYSLSAADLHVVALGDPMVGIIHPCKVYGAMAVARPILCLGPKPSHVSDILDEHRVGWQVSHGDVDEMCRVLQAAATLSPSDRDAMGQRAREAVRDRFNQRRLCSALCDVLERGLALPGGGVRVAGGAHHERDADSASPPAADEDPVPAVTVLHERTN